MQVRLKELVTSKPFLFFLAILAVGIFLRGYHFGPWLHFELDQARDATLIDESIQSAGNLPLLGPRAAGTFARLGPWSYYLEYFFGLVFGDPPIGGAVAILFFACLSLPMFYLLFRRYFPVEKTLALTGLFAVSLYFVTYARFGWNPNLLPFFVLFLIYALLRAFDEAEQPRKRGWFLVGAAAVFSLISQFHFLALIVFGLTGLGFLIYCRPRIGWPYWVGSVLVVLFFYFPVILNDVKTGGDNYNQFVMAFTKKSEDKAGHNLAEKVVKDATENSLYHWIILSGAQTADLPALEVKGLPDVKCDQYCREHLPEGLLAGAVFVVGGLLLLWRALGGLFFPKNKKRLKELLGKISRQGPKEKFLALNLILAIVSFIIFIPLSFDLSARFFLIILPLPFLFLGLIWESIPKKIAWIGWLIVVGLMVSNLYFVNNFFGQLRDAKSVAYELPRDRILKQKTRITLEQEQAIVDLLEEHYEKNNYPIIYKAQPEFHRALAYLLDQRKIPRDGISKSKLCRKANYFLVFRTQSDSNKLKEKYREFFDFGKEEQFGTLTVLPLELKTAKATCEKFDPKTFRNYKNEGGAVAKRYNWGEVLGGK